MPRLKLLARDMMANPDYYNLNVSFTETGDPDWECMRYSRSEKTIVFGRLIPMPNMKILAVAKYVKPDTIVYAEVK